MRGVTKGPSPRNVSPRGQARGSMTEAANRFRISLAAAADKAGHARACFDALDKEKLRKVLVREQRHLCVYCERRLNEGPDTPVEHWRPLNLQPEFALTWHNLYLSCSTKDTCDDSKGGDALAGGAGGASLPWPTKMRYEQCLGFTSFGEVYVRADAPLTIEQQQSLRLAVAHPEVARPRGAAWLNLNHPTLRASRNAAIDAERDLRLSRPAGTYRNRAELRAEGERYLRETPYPPFVSIRIAWWSGTLGKSQP